jgi:2-keto-4-pentenoate hydratase/2-oxohepta-3-ene-1,7-dioic acid hydratase in catechol pathway
MIRVVSFELDGALRAGVEVHDNVVDLAAAGWGDGRPVSVREVLDGGPGSLDRAVAQAIRAVEADAVASWPSAELTLGPVIPNPDKVICVGANYRAHLDESDYPAPPFPEVFAKYPNAVIGSGAPIPVTAVSSDIDFEGELAVIIGERCKNVSRERALEVVAGYTPTNDISARDVQLRVSQWVVGKTFDGFLPLGPGLVPASQVADPQDLELVTRLNGQVMQRSNTSLMIFDIADIIVYLSSMMTLVPGDVICTGTPGGVGLYRDPPVFLKDGDVIEVEIAGLGVLANPVVEEPATAAPDRGAPSDPEGVAAP